MKYKYDIEPLRGSCFVSYLFPLVVAFGANQGLWILNLYEVQPHRANPQLPFPLIRHARRARTIH